MAITTIKMHGNYNKDNENANHNNIENKKEIRTTTPKLLMTMAIAMIPVIVIPIITTKALTPIITTSIQITTIAIALGTIIQTTRQYDSQ